MNKQFWIAAIVVSLTCGTPSPAQLISVRCCTDQADQQEFGHCTTAPLVSTRPATCPTPASCRLGFGNDTSLAPILCDSTLPILELNSGFCSSWTVAGGVVTLECIAKATHGISLFETNDQDLDADFDLSDMATFTNLYHFAPKLSQSGAELVFAECCIPDSVISELAECLSGPLPPSEARGQINPPPQPIDCSLAVLCFAGFTKQLEPGDWLYQTCAQSLEPFASDTIYCASWQQTELPVKFECRGANLPGLSLYILMDLDYDEDVDLFDFAAIQRNVTE